MPLAQYGYFLLQFSWLCGEEAGSLDRDRSHARDSLHAVIQDFEETLYSSRAPLETRLPPDGGNMDIVSKVGEPWQGSHADTPAVRTVDIE